MFFGFFVGTFFLIRLVRTLADRPVFGMSPRYAGYGPGYRGGYRGHRWNRWWWDDVPSQPRISLPRSTDVSSLTVRRRPNEELDVTILVSGRARLDEAVRQFVDVILDRIDATQLQEDVILAAVRRLSETAVHDVRGAVAQAFSEANAVLDARQRKILSEMVGAG
jgi:hypothetical protein